MRISSGEVGLSAQTTYQQEKKTTTSHLDLKGETTLSVVQNESLAQSTVGFSKATSTPLGATVVRESINEDTVSFSEEAIVQQPSVIREPTIQEWLSSVFGRLSSILTEMSEKIRDVSQEVSPRLNFHSMESNKEAGLADLDAVRLDLSETLDSQLRFMAEAQEKASQVQVIEMPEYNREKTVHLEYEQNMLIETRGTVITEDGREIDFKLDIGSVQQGEMDSVQRYRVMDPLVINLNGEAAQLQDMRFTFDLNSDGEDDAIPYLNSGSGFLALDINNDGEVNDGSELFGTKSGNGFIDLAAYDEDGNMWIDENDSIFGRLAVWMQNGDQEEGKLVSLYQAGVGAIHLGNVETNARLFGSSGEVLGFIGQSGVALSEEGRTYNVQSLDLVI